MNPRRFNSCSVLFTELSLLIILATFLFGCGEQGPAGPQGSEGLPGTGPGDLTNPAVQPLVILTNPGNNATGPFSLFEPQEYDKPHFVVVFNKYMAKASMTRRSVTCQGFEHPVFVNLFDAPSPILQKLTRTGSELYDNILAFSIIDSFGYYRSHYRVGRSYTIRMDTAIVDINGNHLRQPFSFSFVPEPYFRVVEMYPEDGEQDVSPSAGITVDFNTTVDASVLNFIELTPPLPGRWRQFGGDSTSASFETGIPMEFGSTHQVSVLGPARDHFGNPLFTPVTSTFTVAGFRVVSAYPRNGALEVPPQSGISISLSGSVDTGTVRQAITIVPTISGTLQSNGYATIQFYPSAGLLTRTRYTITVATSLRAMNGTPLEASYSFSFTTQKLQFDYANPGYGTVNVNRDYVPSFYFNSVLDTSSIRQAFSIAPAASIRLEYQAGARGIIVRPNPLLGSGITYTVTISTALRAASGENLDTPYTHVFTTRQ